MSDTSKPQAGPLTEKLAHLFESMQGRVKLTTCERPGCENTCMVASYFSLGFCSQCMMQIDLEKDDTALRDHKIMMYGQLMLLEGALYDVMEVLMRLATTDDKELQDIPTEQSREKGNRETTE